MLDIRSIVRLGIRHATSTTSSFNIKSGYKIVTVKEMQRFVVDCLMAAGSSRSNAEQQAFMLVEADRRKISNHGIIRLKWLLDDLKKGLCNGCAKPIILNETVSTAWVDGCNAFGSVVGNFCMDLAVKKAKNTGVGVVNARNSNYYGIGTLYVLRAVKQDFIGLSLTNSRPTVVPTRAKEPILGTNPLAFAAPTNDGDSFILDMTTSATSYCKIQLYKMLNLPLPDGWAFNEQDKPTTDASEALDSKRLLPLSGHELTSGYKGYGLGVMVEVLSALLSHSRFGSQKPEWFNRSEPINLGHFFLALNPKCFTSDFKNRLGLFLSLLRTLEPDNTKFPVAIPGDAEKEALGATDRRGGVEFTELMVQNYQQLAESLKIKPLRTCSGLDLNKI